MKNILLTGGAATAVAASLIFAVPAVAAPVGTQVGESIDNTVTVSFSIGTGADAIAQDDVDATDEVAVDRKVNLTLARTDDTETSANPGEEDVAVSYTLTNLSNDALDFALSATNEDGTTSEIDGTQDDNINPDAAFTYYEDDGDGIFNAGDTLVTHIDALPSGDSVTIHVVTDFNTGYSNEDRAIVTLTATAREDDGATTLGGTFTNASSNSADATVVDTVFADTDDDGQTANDGQAFDTDDFVISAADLTASKTSSIVSGAFTGDNSGTYLPGATIQYCILVSNPSGGEDATSVSISDVLPAEVTYDSTFGVKTGGTDCVTPGSVDGTYTALTNTVSGTVSTLAAGDDWSVIFQATID